MPQFWNWQNDWYTSCLPVEPLTCYDLYQAVDQFGVHQTTIVKHGEAMPPLPQGWNIPTPSREPLVFEPTMILNAMGDGGDHL